MYVCVCKAITEKQIEEVARTSSSVGEACKKLGVGSECGICISEVISNQKAKHEKKQESKKS